MKQKGMTQPEFAKFINTTKQQLGKVIKGQRGFSYKKLKEISEITQFPLSFILEGITYSVDESLEMKLTKAEKALKEAYDTIASINAVLK